MHEAYLDYNATTPTRPEVLALLERLQEECFGNPSSIHATGRRARRHLDEAREKMAAVLGVRPNEVIFTSGGTESNNLAIRGAVLAAEGGHIVTSSIEHPAVLETCRALEKTGIAVTYLDVGADGRVEPEAVAAALRDDTVLVSMMWVNNETGIIQPVEEIAAIAAERGVMFHTDAVQALGRVPIDLSAIDLLSLSGHKFCAPKGMGILIVRRGASIQPIFGGGGQQWGLRSGTENVAGAGALAEAARLCCEERADEMVRVGALRDRFESAVTAAISDARVNGSAEHRVANTSNLRFPGADGEAVLIALDQCGVACSSASACAASRAEPSYVLMVMGLTRREAEDSMRFSLGRFTTEADVDKCVNELPAIVERIRALNPAR